MLFKISSMLQSRQKNLVEICPQCCKLIDSAANRLVHDSCGHSKCRICLLQEITGCLICLAESKSSVSERRNILNTIELCSKKSDELQQRKSVITSLAIQLAERKQSEDKKSLSSALPSVDKDTCHLIERSLEKDILFPTDIVKRSTGNFYHLKRVFSQRFFNEDSNKKHKACGTEKNWSFEMKSNENGSKNEDENLEKKSLIVPKHIQVQYYCKIHKTTSLEKSSILKHHMTCDLEEKTHENLPHYCKFCNKRYKEIGKLNRHLKTHTKNSKFKCMQCGKSCTDNYALKTHERSHSKQKPYSCSSCYKKFSGLQNFKRHEKKHRDEKKFICNECGFRFITKCELKRHGATHSSAKPHVCTICSHKFTFKRTLVRHLKTHDSKLLRISCPYCESTFRRKDNLERHIKTAHFEIKNEKDESHLEIDPRTDQ